MRVFAGALCTFGFAGGLLAAVNPPDKTEPATPKVSVAAKKPVKRVGWPPAAGVKTPGIQIYAGELKSEADVATAASFLAFGESVLAAGKDAVARIDPKTNKILEPVAGLKKKCFRACQSSVALSGDTATVRGICADCRTSSAGKPRLDSLAASERNVRLRLSASSAWLRGFGVTTTAPAR